MVPGVFFQGNAKHKAFLKLQKWMACSCVEVKNKILWRRHVRPSSGVVWLLRRMLIFCLGGELAKRCEPCRLRGRLIFLCQFVTVSLPLFFLASSCCPSASCLSRCLSREARGRAVPWWRTLTRSMKRRRRKRRTRTGPRRSSSSSTLRTRWWCEGPATSLCKSLSTQATRTGESTRIWVMVSSN